MKKELQKIARKNTEDSDLFNNYQLKRVNKTQLTGFKSGSRQRNREIIRIRDNHKCQICSYKWKEGDRRLDIHHIIGNQEDSRRCKLEPLNMITVCHQCHCEIDRDKMGGWKLNEYDIGAIENKLKEGVKQDKISKDFNISQCLVSKIKNGLVHNSPK